MPQLVNTQTNQLEEVPQDQMGESLNQGSHNLVAGQSVNVMNPDGQLVSIPAHQVPEAIQQGYQFAKQADITHFQDQRRFGEGAAPFEAAAAGAARSASFGLSDIALTGSGAVEPQTLEKLKEYNPTATTVGEVGGIAGSLLLGPELAPVKLASKLGQATSEAAAPAIGKAASLLANPKNSPIIHKILSQAPAAALGSAAEGALYGTGETISEAALGDPSLNAQKVMNNIGYSALIAGGIGGVLGGTLAGLEGSYSKIAPYFKKGQAAQEIGKDAEAGAASPQAFAAEVPGIPQSLADITAKVKQGGFDTFGNELTAKTALKDAVGNLEDLNYPVHNLQLQSLDNPRARDIYKTILESGSEEGQALKAYEGLQKNEAVGKTFQSIKNLAPEGITSDAVQAGDRAIDAFTHQYQTEKEALAPTFKKVDEVGLNQLSDRGALLNKLEQSIPDSSKYIKLSDQGELSLEPYKASMPFSKNAYGAIQDLLEGANDKNLTLGGLRNIRESMRDRINWLSAPRESSQISSLRKNLMDYLEDQVQKISPDLQVRDTFRRYAVNEQNRETIEKIFGGSISDKAQFGKQIKSEDVLDKIFSNTNSIQAAKSILGDVEFKNILGNYLNLKAHGVTDLAKNGFSSNKFASFLRQKAPELQTAFSDNPQGLKRIQSLTDFMRILPDSPSVNPSGTAKTLNILEKLKGLKQNLEESKSGLLSFAAKKGIQALLDKTEGARLKNVMDAILSGKTVEEAESQVQKQMIHYSFLSKIEELSNKSSQQIQKASKKVFDFSSENRGPISGYIGSKLVPDEKQKKSDQIFTQIQNLQQNPGNFIDHMQNMTKGLNHAAPQISQQIQQSFSTATQFLASKIPQNINQKPLSGTYVPSTSELSKFARYYDIVQEPAKALEHLKNSTLTRESMEALSTVYPQLYDEMKTQVIQNLTNFLSKNSEKNIPMSTKISLSLFLGQDMMNSLSPNSIQTNQLSISQSGKSPENNQTHGAKVSQTGLSKITRSERTLTPMQASSQRGQ